jgi:hypothetical protein
MKRLEDHTDEELVSLSQQQIQDLIDLECAHEGIPLLPEMPKKPEIKKPEPDLTLYEVPDACFQNQEDANRVIDLMNSLPRMHQEYYGKGYVKSKELETIRMKKEFSEEARIRTKAQTASANEAENRYEKEKKTYDDIANQRKDVIDKVTEAVNEAFYEFRKISQYKKQYTRYLQLSEGEKDIALNFMRAAHPGEDEFIDKMLSSMSDDIMLGTQVPADDRAPLP